MRTDTIDLLQQIHNLNTWENSGAYIQNTKQYYKQPKWDIKCVFIYCSSHLDILNVNQHEKAIQLSGLMRRDEKLTDMEIPLQLKIPQLR